MLVLRTDQKKDVRKIHHFHGRVLLSNQMRLGKTIVTLQWLTEAEDAFPAIVVSPEIGKFHWYKQARKHFDIRGKILEGETAARKKPLHIHDMYYLNFDIIYYWYEYINKLKPKTIIIDECHWIKNTKAYCSKAVRKITSKNKPHEFPYGFRGMYIIAIGGTPLKSRPIELYNVLNLIRPDKFPSRVLYAHKFCDPKKKPWGWEYKGATNSELLHKRLAKYCLIRKLRKDVDEFIEPDKVRKIITMKLSDREEYDEAERDFIKWLRKRSASRVKKAKKAKRLVQTGYLKRLAVELKMRAALRWLDKWLKKHPHKKLAIFAIQKPIIKILNDRYKKISVKVDGSIRGKKRERAVYTFQNKKHCRVFIGNTQAAATVIELSKASAACMIEIDWTPGDITQVEDRIIDPNAKKKKRLIIYYLVAADTIEEILCRIIQSKQEVLSNTLDGKSSKNKLNIFDLLEEELLKKERRLL